MSTVPGAVPSLSVFFFSSVDTGATADRYAFMLESVALAERLGFEAAWVPERHFHAFGGLFPNPAVVAAALAVRTERIGLRAGSVVLPLHHVARVAEEWAVVDALSGGRVGLSLATGWNEADFVFGTCDYDRRREHMFAQLDPLRRLWRGDVLDLGGAGPGVRTYPTPMQRALPLWLTATSGSATFEEAGRRGLNVLTAYLQQGREQLEGNIARYRDRFAACHPGARPHVTLMVHAHVAGSTARAMAEVRDPLLAYLGQFVDLNQRGQLSGGGADEVLTEDEKDALVRYSVHKYATERGMIGDDAVVAERLRYFAGAGVDELACFVDFGLDPELVRGSLERLAAIRADLDGSAA